MPNLTTTIEQPAGQARSMRCIRWQPYERNTLMGFAALQQPSGVIIEDATLHEKDGKYWVSPPGKPKLDKDGVAHRNRETGKISYSSVITFTSDEVRRRWSDDAVAAIRCDFPAAFEPERNAAVGSKP